MMSARAWPVVGWPALVVLAWLVGRELRKAWTGWSSE